MTHFSPECCKKLMGFMGEGCPEPIDPLYLGVYEANKDKIGGTLFKSKQTLQGFINYPIYQLHDVLSKPFCEAFEKRYSNSGNKYSAHPMEFCHEFLNSYYNGGLEAVERTLMGLMEAK